MIQQKSFLFDVVSKVYVATDSNPVDTQAYELCADMIDVVIDVSCIYGSVEWALGCIVLCGGGRQGCACPLPPNKHINQPIPNQHRSVKYDPETGEAAEGSPYDADSASTIRLSNGMVLYLREVDE